MSSSSALYWLLLAAVLLAGTLMPAQAGINSLLARELSSTLAAATLSFLVGGTALALLLILQPGDFRPAGLLQLNWWLWTGGLIGAFFVFTAAWAAPRTGALLFTSLVLAGQLLGALLLDHQGWLGFRENPVNPAKIGGIVLIVLGVWLIRR